MILEWLPFACHPSTLMKLTSMIVSNQARKVPSLIWFSMGQTKFVTQIPIVGWRRLRSLNIFPRKTNVLPMDLDLLMLDHHVNRIVKWKSLLKKKYVHTTYSYINIVIYLIYYLAFFVICLQSESLIARKLCENLWQYQHFKRGIYNY